jgi:iron complex outermembrane receptor protein
MRAITCSVRWGRLVLFALLISVQAFAGDAAPDTLTHADGEMVVHASRYGETAHLSYTNITAQELETRIGVTDIPMLLEDTPGLHAYSDAGNGIGYTYLNIRGFDQKRVGVMINGIPLNDPEDHQVYWVDLPDFASNLEDIQVQRGITNSMGATTAIGGTVNLVTDRLSLEEEADVTMMAGNYNTWRLAGGYQTGLVNGRYQSAVRLSRIETDGYRDRTGSKLWSVFWSGKAMYTNHTLQANFYTGHEESQHGWNAAFEDDLATNRRHNPETYDNAIDDFRQPHYELHHDWTLSSKVSLHNSAYLIHGAGFYENFKDGRTASDFSLDHSLGLDPDEEVDLVRRKIVDKDQLGLVSHLEVQHTGGRLIVGGDIYDFHSNHSGEVLDVIGYLDSVTKGVPYYGYQGDKTAWSIYANEAAKVLPGLTLMADLQYQHKEHRFKQDQVGNFDGEDRHAYQLDYDFFNPKGGLNWELPSRPLGGKTMLYGHVGLTHREPTDGEVFDTWQGPDDLGVAPLFANSIAIDDNGDGVTDYLEWSNPVAHEEKVINYEMGMRWRGENLSFTLNGYWMEFEDEIVAFGAVDDDGFPVKGNIPQSLHRGVELGLSAWITDNHVLKVAASRSWDEIDEFTRTTVLYDESWNVIGTEEESLSGNPISLFPEHLASVAFESDFGAMDTRVRVRSVGRQYLDLSGDSTHTIDGYTTVDLALGIELEDVFGPSTSSTRVDLRILNLLDKSYETWGYWYGGRWLIPAATRQALVGIHTKF